MKILGTMTCNGICVTETWDALPRAHVPLVLLSDGYFPGSLALHSNWTSNHGLDATLRGSVMTAQSKNFAAICA
eukprot:7080435-Pyramimonas_sp.AAC.1